MNSNDRADLLFELAEILEEYEQDNDPEEVHARAIGYIKGRQP